MRRSLVDDMPVTATAMRVPDGDVVCRAAAVCEGSARAVVMEFGNGTPAPVSLALAVAPQTALHPLASLHRLASRRATPFRRAAAPAAITKAEVRGSKILADGRVAVDLGRPPGGAAAVADGRPWTAVRSGPSAGDCAARSRTGQAAGAAVMPLAPGVPLRVIAPVEGGPVKPLPPSAVAAGWRSVVARAAHVGLADEAAGRAWRRDVAASILLAGCGGGAAAARSAVALDLIGLPHEADRARAALLRDAERSRLAGGGAVLALRALASRRLRSGRASGLDQWAGPLVAASGRHLDAATVEQVAAALSTEAPAAAADARILMSEGLGDVDLSAPAAVGQAAPPAERVLSVVRRLVSESPRELTAAPELRNGWLGAPLDVQGLRTRHGRLSYSVRWHGPRPALLWQLSPSGAPSEAAAAGLAEAASASGSFFAGAGGGGAGTGSRRTVMRCGLDRSWSSLERQGEVLLRVSG